MTGYTCCVPGCHHNSLRNRNVSYHAIPKEKKIRHLWLARINKVGPRQYRSWFPKDHHKICGIHFNISGIRQKEDLLPIYFPNHKYFDHRAKNGKRTVVCELNIENNIQKINTDKTNKNAPPLASLVHNDHNYSVCDSQATHNNVIFLQAQQKEIARLKIQVTELVSDVTRYKANSENDMILLQTREKEIAQLNIQVTELVSDVTRYKANSEISVVLLQTQEEEIAQQRIQVKELVCDVIKYKVISEDLQLQLSKIKTNCMNIEDNIKNEQILQFYTGFTTREHFMRFANLIEPDYRKTRSLLRKNTEKSDGRHQNFTYIEQLFIVMSRLRLGLLEKDLAYRYNTSIATISRMCSFWVNLLSGQLKQIPFWPNKTTVNECNDEFKYTYPNTRIILDWTEIYTETSLDYLVQNDTYSAFKSPNTAKGFIGFTPNGYVSFVSKLYSGRVSDRAIIEDSKIVDLLRKNNGVLAHRGITIEVVLREKGILLNTPPFLKGKNSQLAKDMQRAIKHIRSFRILKFAFPNSMHSILNKIWIICCYLPNFNGEPLLDE